MAYERLNKQQFDTWKASDVEHIEDYLEKTLVPENEGALEETSDILIDSEPYWNIGFIQTPTLNPNREGKISASLGNAALTVDYISSPIIELDMKNKYTLKLTGGHWIRQFYILNSSGKYIFSCGNSTADLGTYDSDQQQIFYGGMTQASFTKFIKSDEALNICPTVVSTWKFGELTFTEEIVQELNTLKITKTSSTITYVPGEKIYIYFTLKTPTARPTTEESANSWFLKQVPQTKLYETVYSKIYELSQLAILNPTTNKYYKSKLLNNILGEIGEFEKKLGLENEVVKTQKITTTYSELMTQDFYPSAYHGYYINYNFNITDFEGPTYSGATAYSGYKITMPLPIDLSIEGASYSVSGNMRHFAFLRADGTLIYYGQNNSSLAITKAYFENLNIDPFEVRWLCVSNPESYHSSFKYTTVITKKNTFFEMPNLRLTDEQSAGGGGEGSNTGASNLIDLTNVDRIVAIGDSYTESHYTIKDKSWISKVSLLSDYNYDNFAISGDTYRGQLNKIRTGNYSYASTTGMTWEQLHPTHAIMISKTNDTKYMNTQQFVYDMIATIETTKGLGAIPIICTEYHVSNHDHVQTAFDYYAKKYGGYCIDLTKYDYTLRGTDYAPFWGGSHPGTRSNHLFVDPIVDYINKYLPRPYSSIKIFRARDNSKISNLDSYIFNTTEERAEKFKEISICHSALRNPALYDSCTGASNGKIESEYFKLMSNLPVSFDKVCMIDVILPTTVHDITEVQLITNELEGVNCYVKDVLAEPYPSPAFCRRFDIPGVLTESQVAVGNTYTSNKSTGATYKVVEIIYDQVESASGFIDGTILICSGNKTTGAYDNSTLTLVSGTGDSTLQCNYEAVGLSSDYPAGKQDVGHYVLLEEYGLVSDYVLKRAVDYDKITFLLISDSEFELRNIQVKFKGNITKTRTTPQYTNSKLPYWDDYTALNAHPKFDDDNISYWLNSSLKPCGLIPTTVADNVLPKNISKIITLNPSDGKIVQNFGGINNNASTRDINRKVRVWARYFPDIFDANTMTYPDQAPITENTFDYAKLGIHLYDVQSNISKDISVEMQKLVGLHWTEIELDLIIPTVNKTWYIGLEAIDKPIQLAYCDVI